MSKIIATNGYKKDGIYINGYLVKLEKTKVEESGFKNGDEVEREYLPNKIIITKK